MNKDILVKIPVKNNKYKKKSTVYTQVSTNTIWDYGHLQAGH